MKILALLLTVTSMHLAARGYAQGINLSFRQTPIEKVFAAIELQSPFRFVYTMEAITGAKAVTASVSNGSIEQVLKICFADQPLSYTIEEHFIIVKLKEKTAAVPAAHPVSGTVVNEKGEPVSGVTVQVKGTNLKTVTDDNGQFHFADIDPQAALLISGAEITALQVSVAGQQRIAVTVVQKTTLLDETIIKGYYSVQKRLNTGSVSKITAEEISRQPVTNVLSAVQGRASGVFVNTLNGMPGGAIKIQVRGKNSISAGTEPLYVIDGIPFSSAPLNQGFVDFIAVNGETSPLNALNPSDIESIDILKDADATSLYGSRGANGVVLITTKKGRAGKTKFSVTAYQGVSAVSDFPDLLNLQQFLALRREGFANDGVTPTVLNAPELLLWDTTKQTNWPEFIWGHTASITDVQASVSGGSENTRFLAGAGYRSEGTILPGNKNFQRASGHFNLDHSTADKKFNMVLSAGYTADNSKLVVPSTISAINLAPNFPSYDNTGNLNWIGAPDSPVGMLKRKSSSQSTAVFINTLLKYALSPELLVRVSAGYSINDMVQVLTTPKSSLNPGSSSYTSSAAFGNNRYRTFIIEPQLNYTKKIKKGIIDALAGVTWQKSLRSGDIIKGSDYSNETLLESLAAAGKFDYAISTYSEYKYASAYLRAGYSYDKKYIVNVTARRDGSSRFGPGNQYGNFAAISGGWIFSDEAFMQQQHFLSYGKLRGSYGISGNDQIPDYQYLSSYAVGTVYQSVASFTPSIIANSTYGWERNKKTEVALELGFLRDKLLLTTAWFINRSDNQLVTYPLPYQSGFASYQANLPALVQNTGFEFEVAADVISKKSLKWSPSFNLTIPKNKLVSYPGLAASSNATLYAVGEDLSIKKGFHFTGVDPHTGLAQYQDLNNDGQLTQPADFIVVGKTSPDYYGGFNNNLGYKSWSLSVFVQFVGQHSFGTDMFPGYNRNQYAVVLNRWRKPGDITNIPRASAIPGSTGFTGNSNLPVSDAFFYNASYLRMKNISLSYELPQRALKNLHFEKLRLYTELQNLFTIKKRANFYDPETLSAGVPPLRTIVAGIQLTF